MIGEHHFHVSVAVEVGVNAAVLLEQFNWWISKNQANGKHFHDGRYWTYNSTKAFAEMYPYMSQKAVKNALRKLEDGGYIVVGDYNENRMKRPNWYSITEKGYSLLFGANMPKGTQGVVPKGPVEESQRDHTLYIDNSYSSTDSCSSNQSCVSDQRDNTSAQRKEVIDYLNERLGTRYTYRNKEINGYINARLSEGFTVADFKTVIDNKVASWKGTEWEQYLRPKTLFAPSHFEDYLNERPKGERNNAEYSEYDQYF